MGVLAERHIITDEYFGLKALLQGLHPGVRRTIGMVIEVGRNGSRQAVKYMTPSGVTFNIPKRQYFPEITVGTMLRVTEERHPKHPSLFRVSSVEIVSPDSKKGKEARRKLMKLAAQMKRGR